MTAKIAFTGLDQQKARLRQVIDAKISQVVDHGQFIMGPEVIQFEQALSNYCGAKHSITVANGTDALQIALMVLGVGSGDAVFVPSFTYTATAEVILVLGARPVFVDVNPNTFNLDPADLPRALDEAKLSGLTPKAIIGVDLFGLPAEWNLINGFAEANGLVTIGDAAQSFGGVTGEGKSVGTLAKLSTTSFFQLSRLDAMAMGEQFLRKTMKWLPSCAQSACMVKEVRNMKRSALD